MPLGGMALFQDISSSYSMQVRRLTGRELRITSIQGHSICLVASWYTNCADWCPDCIRLGRENVQRVADELQAHLTIVQVGTREEWRTSNHPLRTDPSFRITGVPTLLHWTANGANPQRLGAFLPDITWCYCHENIGEDKAISSFSRRGRLQIRRWRKRHLLKRGANWQRSLCNCAWRRASLEKHVYIFLQKNQEIVQNCYFYQLPQR
jgi:hypothetical protein